MFGLKFLDYNIPFKQELGIKEEPQSTIALSVSLVVSDHFSVVTSDDLKRHEKLFTSSSD
jgi:hypothetical protein